MKKVNASVSNKVGATTWLDAHLVHAYLNNKYKSNPNILVIPTTNPKSFEAFYLETCEQIDSKLYDTLTDIIIPFHMEPNQHFTLMHVKLVGPSRQPVIYWLDSLGNPMPESVERRLNVVFQQSDKVVHKHPIKSQQKDGYDCGVYVALNADAMVHNQTKEFKTMTAEQSVALRKEMVAVANQDAGLNYVFVDAAAPKAGGKAAAANVKASAVKTYEAKAADAKVSVVEVPAVNSAEGKAADVKASVVEVPAINTAEVKTPAVAATAPKTTEAKKPKFKASKPKAEDWNQNKFINTVSQDLLQFGESLQDTANAFDEFDRAFDSAAAAYQEATNSLSHNPHAFFSEYQKLQAQLAHYKAEKASVKKSCAAEVEPMHEAGKKIDSAVY